MFGSSFFKLMVKVIFMMIYTIKYTRYNKLAEADNKRVEFCKRQSK